MHLFVLERPLHGSPAGLVARNMVDPDPRKFSEGEKLFQRIVPQHIVALSRAKLHPRTAKLNSNVHTFPALELESLSLL